MLLSDDVDYEIIDTMGNLSDNILGLHIRIASHSLILFSVYGPNLDNISFFQDLSGFYHSFQITQFLQVETGI